MLLLSLGIKTMDMLQNYICARGKRDRKHSASDKMRKCSRSKRICVLFNVLNVLLAELCVLHLLWSIPYCSVVCRRKTANVFRLADLSLPLLSSFYCLQQITKKLTHNCVTSVTLEGKRPTIALLRYTGRETIHP